MLWQYVKYTHLPIFKTKEVSSVLNALARPVLDVRISERIRKGSTNVLNGKSNGKNKQGEKGIRKSSQKSSGKLDGPSKTCGVTECEIQAFAEFLDQRDF